MSHLGNFSTTYWCVLEIFPCQYIGGEGNGTPLQYSCLENPVDPGTWWVAIHGVTQSWTRLKRLSMHACIGEGNGNPLKYSCLENPRDRGAWGLPSMGSHKVGHDWGDSAAAAAAASCLPKPMEFLLLLRRSPLFGICLSPVLSENIWDPEGLWRFLILTIENILGDQLALPKAPD